MLEHIGDGSPRQAANADDDATPEKTRASTPIFRTAFILNSFVSGCGDQTIVWCWFVHWSVQRGRRFNVGIRMFAAWGWEGIVSKRTDAPYRSGLSKTWLKTKNPASEAVRREREEDWSR